MNKILLLFCLIFALTPSSAQKKGGKVPIAAISEQAPEFRGGEDSLMRFITANLQYPKSALANGVQGKVVISYAIDETGKVVEPQVISISYNNEHDFYEEKRAMEKEALRVMQLMPQWNPGKINGKNVQMDLVMPITFSISD